MARPQTFSKKENEKKKQARRLEKQNRKEEKRGVCASAVFRAEPSAPVSEAVPEKACGDDASRRCQQRHRHRVPAFSEVCA